MLASERLETLQGVGPEEIEILESIGVDRVTSLAGSDSSSLYQEMSRANRMLRILPEIPEMTILEGWIQQARAQAGERLEAVTAGRPVGPTERGTLANSLELLPEAVLIHPAVLMEKGIQAGDVPAVKKFYSGGTGPAQKAVEKQKQVGRRSEPVEVPTAGRTSVRKAEAIQPFQALATTKEGAAVAPLERKGRSLLTAPAPGTNDGRKQHSRAYIRGVLHPQPARVKVAALVALVALPIMLLVPVALAVTFFYKEYWMYLAGVPVLALLMGILYLTIATKPRCRICGQPMFVPKKCFRHVKAHHVPLIGYIIPTSLQLLLFKWFRCIFCGTAIRLKE